MKRKKRYRILLLNVIFLLLCFININAQNRHVRFEKASWKQIFKKAEKENKIIFVDCYFDGCGPCAWMHQYVMTNDSVADFYNKHFVCVEMDLYSKEVEQFQKTYSVTAYPTYLYLNPKGEMLHRRCASSPPAEFMAAGQMALSPTTRLSTYKQLFKGSRTEVKIAYTYFNLMEGACLLENKMVEKYLAFQNDSTLKSYYNWQLIFRFAGYNCRAYNYFESHLEVFSNLYGRDSVEKKINQVYAEQLYMASLKKNSMKFDELKARFKKCNTRDFLSIVQHADLRLVKQPYADLKNALQITDSIVGPMNVSKGFGLVRDFNREANSAWFRLDIGRDTLLTFDIVPNDSLDDYDFAIFKCPDLDCIGDINTGKIKHERLCYSYCTSKSGVTGLSEYTRSVTVGEGPGPAYAAALRVKAGETYYLVVDFAELYVREHRSPLGFRIYFYNYWPKRTPILLRNVLFENNKAELSKASYLELDKLVTLLKKNQMKIEVQGHTDNRGNAQQNQELSEKRAKAVVDYLLSNNIRADRLFFKGFGSTKPITSNEELEGRQKNRRVEFVIVMN